MAGLVLNNLNLKPGQCIGIKGVVPKDAKSFAINLGKDSSNYVLHLNPRFDREGDINTIVCNSKEADVWGEEQRESTFPFQQGETMEVCISFDKSEIKVKLSGDHELKFPNRLSVDKVDYLEVDCLQIKGLKFD
ncbi:galectin-1-like [Rhinatrema bivittatum]|uniref:galectin-1-like n=1 Tax=Rhinatrema bivittatum TaxID=194408 RepID=UPI00112CA827|nr:galectin-1-like [Rhinatrema bivittatum]